MQAVDDLGPEERRRLEDEMLAELGAIGASPAEVAQACAFLRAEMPRVQATIARRVLALRAATDLCDRIAATLAMAPTREEIRVAAKERAALPDGIRALRQARAVLLRIAAR